MKHTAFIAFSLCLLFLTAGIIILMKKNNNHIECGKEVIYSTGKDGAKIKTEKHICKEKNNF
ncbi:hypothetical protein HNP38_001360 [Chryseobacterium defluvii]|uniref:Uncharacterized protein n=1 Tax=Chryseobacterium defluvii TaxID=160396 RepID=A0A840KDL9_9FLAO|nr:hypothetical protein [Chryseobacterium defluvii]